MDFTWMISLFILAIHFYISCYLAFKGWGWTVNITDHIIADITKIGLLKPKIVAPVFLVISIIGIKSKKIQKITIIAYLLTGMVLYSSACCVFTWMLLHLW